MRRTSGIPSLIAMLLPALSAFAAAGEGTPSGGTARWRCVWPNPAGDGAGGARGASLDITFDGDAFLVAAPGDTVHMTGESAPGRPARLRVVDGRGAGAWTERLAVKLPPAAAGQPAPGLRKLLIELAAPDGATVAASASFWFHPPLVASSVRGGLLRVGEWPVGTYRRPAESGNAKVRNHPDSYRPPRLFVAMSPETAAARVTARLRLGDLVVPSEDSGERHTDLVPVNYPLWTASEAIRDALATRGIPGGALRIISGFRAPAYNRRVGSGHFGRHAFGDALDFMIDADGDGATDDLDGDGRVDRRDGLWLVALLEELMADGAIPLGGVGCYTFATSPKKVTWHYDQRGHRATWGYHYNAAGRKGEFAWQSRRFAEVDAAERAAARDRAARAGKPYAEARRDPLPIPSPRVPRP